MNPHQDAYQISCLRVFANGSERTQPLLRIKYLVKLASLVNQFYGNYFTCYTAKLFNEVASLQDDLLLDEVRKVCAQVNKSRPYELKQGRWPYDPIGRQSVYMAEENQKFI
jgi:hypothetical protein